MDSLFIGTRFEAFKILSINTNVKLIITKKFSFIDKFVNKNLFRVIYVNKKNKENIFKIIDSCHVKIVLSSGFPFILPKKIFLKKNKIFLNSHPSLLPKYKGIRPIVEAIKNKERQIGITVHLMNENLDAGKILVQKKYNLKNNSNINYIYKELFSILEHQAIDIALKKIKGI